MKLMKIMKLGISPSGILAFCLLGLIPKSQAQSFVVHNLDVPNSEVTEADPPNFIATSFTTGSQSATLAGLVARYDWFAGEMFIYDNSALNEPGSSIGTFLDNPMDRGSNNEFLFTPDGTISLAASTTYWMVYEGGVQPHWVASDSETSNAGWTIGDRFYTADVDNNGIIIGGWDPSFSNPAALQFGIIIPEPSTYAFVSALAIGIFIFIKRRRERMADF